MPVGNFHSTFQQAIGLLVLNVKKMRQFKSIRIILILTVVISIFGCKKKDNAWTLIGNTEIDGTVYLFKVSAEQERTLIDSTTVEKGKFTFKTINPTDHLTPYQFDFAQDNKGGFEFLIVNGQRMKAMVTDSEEVLYSGTKICETYNKYNAFRQREMQNMLELKKVLSDTTISEDKMNEEMVLFNEKKQDIENEKIDFLKSIENPELNSYLILRETYLSGVIEKEVFGKYLNALTPESSMTNSGHRLHEINEVFPAYALSREMDILDSATIQQRYDKLDEDNKNSVYAQKVLEHLQNLD